MAGDWIPFFTDTPRKTEILIIARETGRSRHEVVGLLTEFWCWVQSVAHQRLLKRLKWRDVCEAVGGDEAFWLAVEATGWVQFTDEGIEVPNASDWLENGAKSRLLKAKRQKRYRTGKKNVDGSVDADVDGGAPPNRTPEESRVEDINTSPNQGPDDSSKNESDSLKDKPSGPTQQDHDTAKFIWSLILQMQPKRKTPDIEKWANDVRLMRERDGRTDEQIRDVFKAANSDPFWRTNVLSPSKLRKKYDDLELKFKLNRRHVPPSDDEFLPPRNRGAVA